MILAAMILATSREEPVLRTSAAYWFPASEGISKWIPRLVDEECFDRWIVDPRPNSLTKQAASKAKIAIVKPSSAYSLPNSKWRSATIELIQGKLSPAEWLKKTANLRETYHYLTTPKSPDLRSLTSSIPNGLNTFSGRAVFGETLICYWPGTPCFYSTDIVRTNYFPENKQHESWILAMNDFLGPMLSFRADHPGLVTKKPTIIRADTKPGMLIFQQKIGRQTFTFYFNSGLTSQKLPKEFKVELAIMPRGLDLDTPDGPYILGSGSMMTMEPPE